MLFPSRAVIRSFAVAATILTFSLAVARAQSTVHWKKDHIHDATGAEVATATPAPSDQTAPTAPASLGATVNGNSVTFSWGTSTDSGGSGLAGYKLYRGNLPIAVVGSGTTGYTDATIQPQTGYSYTVRSFDGAGNHSSASNTASFTSASAGTGVYDGGNSLVSYFGSGWANDTSYYPLAYNGTQHYSQTAGDRVAFSFSGSSITVIYNKYPHMGIASVAIDGNDMGNLDMYAASGQWQTPQTYSGMASGNHTITLTVSGQKNASSTNYYMILDAFAVGTSLPPAPASGLAATAASASQINLTWTDNSANESGFKIERKIGIGGTYSEVDTVGANATSYSSTGLANGTVYYYRVRSYNGSGNAAYSDSANACNCTIAGTGNYDGDHSYILYSGSGWYHDPNSYPDAYNSTLLYSNSTGLKATFSFNGTSIAWAHLRFGHMGIANVIIDGNNMGDVDLYSSANLWQQSSTWSGLSSGNHTITITITGQKNASATDYYVDIDGLFVN